MLVVSLGAARSGLAADKLYVQTPADRDNDALIDDKVKQQCGIENRISYFAQESAKEKFEVVPSKTLADAGNSKALSLTVLDVQGIGGGAWTGSKTIALQGTLRENGEVTGTFIARCSSRGGMLGPVQGTCSIFERNAEALGKDIAAWVAHPRMNARLSEMD
jgi:hypothetical protein